MATGCRYIRDKHGNRLQVYTRQAWQQAAGIYETSMATGCRYILDKHGNMLQVYTIGGASGSREGLGFVIEECYECVVFLGLVSSS